MISPKITFILIFSCCLLLSGSDTIFAPLLGTREIRIDGKGDDPVWQRAAVLNLKNNQSGRGMSHSRLRMFADTENLYIFGEFDDPAVTDEKEAELPRDQINWQNTAEFFLAAADSKNYFHIAIDSAGNCYDSDGQAPAHDFQSSCEYKTLKVPGKGWQFEIRIPLKELRIKTPLTIGDTLNINLCRTATALPDRLFALFLTHGSFHNRAAFGTLRIGNVREVAAFELEKRKDMIIADEYRSMREEVDAMRRLDAYDRLMERLGNLERLKKLAGADASKLWIFQPSPAAPSPAGDVPEQVFPTPYLRREALRGESLTVAIGVFNPTPQAVRLRCVPSDAIDLNNPVRVPFRNFGAVRIVREVPIRGGATQRDPLPELRIEDVVTVLPETNEIIYLTLDTANLAPGRYGFSLDLLPLMQQPERSRVTFDLEVYNPVSPEAPAPLVHDWARYHWPPTAAYPEACYKQQKEHGTNVVMSDVFGKELELFDMKFTDDGKLIEAPEFAALEKKFRTFGPDYHYILGLWKRSLPAQFFTGAHAEENFGRYLTALLAAANRSDIDPRHIMFSLADEPRDATAAAEVADTGKMIEKCMPGVFNTFLTVDHNSSREMIETMAPYVTVWCPKIDLDDVQKRIKEYTRRDAIVMGYRVLSRSKMPYQDYRLSGLATWSRGMAGLGFWNYCDAGDSDFSTVWDDFDPATPWSDFSVIYEGSTGPVPSVRYEMWREGVQDYRFAAALKLREEAPGSREALEKAAEALRQPQNPDLADAFRNDARKLLAGLPADAKPSRPVYCLTGNSYALANVPFKGHYTVDGKTFAAGSEQAKLLDGSLRRPIGVHSFKGPLLEFDLASSRPVDFAVFQTTDNAAGSYRLEASSDGQQWTAFPVTLSGPAARGNWYAARLDGNSYRYLRLNTNHDKNKQFGEFMIFGY